MQLPDHLRPIVEALIGRLELTSGDVAREANIELDDARRLWRALGFPPVPDDARVFARADVEIVAAIRDLLARHRLEPAALFQLTRLTGRSLARIADAQIGATDQWLPEGMNDPAAVAGFAAELERLLGYAWRRHLLAALLRRAVTPGAAEAATAVGFADLVGFTTLSQVLDATELAALVDRFEAIAYEHIPERGGRIVKMIGDEVMFSVDDGVAAAEIALGLADAHARDPDLPAVRVGVARGPVLAWDGDVFGPTVNLASRLVNVARPGTVLVDDALGAELQDVPGLALRHLRPVRLRGIGRVRTWVVRRAGA
jgi:adenylate cyclase